MTRLQQSAVFLAALALRLLQLWQSTGSPAFAVPIVDAASYHEIASRWAAGFGAPRDIFWQSPFYPAFLAAVYRVAGVSIPAAKVAQACLGALTAVLTGWLGTVTFDRRVGLIAGLIVAGYGPLIFFESELVGAGLAVFWAVLLLLVLVRAGAGPTRPVLVFWGAAAGAAFLTRAEFLPFVLAATGWLLRRATRNGGLRRLVAGALCVCAGCLLLLAPAAIESRRLCGRIVLAPASGGLNLFLGNNAQRCDSLNIRPGWAWSRLLTEPLRAGGGEAFDSGGYFVARVLRYGTLDPLGLLSGLAEKALELVSSREIPRNVDVYLSREWSSLLGLLVWKLGRFGFPFGVLFPLGLAGAVLLRRRLPPPLLFFIALYPAAVVAVFPAARYRIPLVPVLAVLAAACLVRISEAVASRQGRTLRDAGVWVGAGIMISSFPGAFCGEKTDLRPEFFALTGLSQLERGDAGRAGALLARALELDPNSVAALNGLGNLRLQQGRREEARELYLRAAREPGGREVALNNLGNLLAQEQRPAEARRDYEEALAENPLYAEAQNNLGVLLSQAGDSRAESHLREAVRINGRYEEAWNNLANFLSRQHRPEEAEQAYRRVLGMNPRHAVASFNLALLLQRQGRSAAAREHAEAALRIDPGLRAARVLLDTIVRTGASDSP